MDLSELEALALGTDRAAALANLLPGTAEHDYWRGVFLQHDGRLADVDAILAGWRQKHGNDGNEATQLYERLRKRQLLATMRVDLPGVAKELLRETGTRLEDRAEVVVQAERFPTRLDPALLDRRKVLAEASKRRANLADVTDAALPDIVRDRTLIPGFDLVVRAILQRLRRADLPGTVDLIAADLADKNGSNGQFGALSLHTFLTLAQLEELARLLPDLRQQRPWVDAVLQRHAPASWVDMDDRDERARVIDRAYAFATTLAPAFNTMKATLLYHRLELDRAAGTYDRARFRAYIELPRSAPWAERTRVRTIAQDWLVQPSANVVSWLQLAPIGDDEPLVKDYLARFLLEEDASAYTDWLDHEWLAKLMATTRLLAGLRVEESAKLLTADERDALRDRVDLALAPQNPRTFDADDDVTLEVDVKNVRTLEVKVFRIDALAYWLAKKADVGMSIDLDGMVPSGQEQTLTFDHPPIRRHRVRIDLPACKRPGTYVVELVGNGRSSRALFRKGSLRFLQRTSAAGTVVTVTDAVGRPLPDARLWLGGRELAPREGAAITIPFGTSGMAEDALLVHGDVVQRASLQRPSESPSLRANFHVERESLVANTTARILCRPRLALAGAPVSLALLENTEIELAVTTLTGTSRRVQPALLRDDEDTVVEINVPDGATELRARLRGRLRIVSQSRTIDVADEIAAPINGIHASEATAMLHLARISLPEGDRFVLSLLGKTGEPLAGRAVALALEHRDVTTPIEVTLETNADGAIDLGVIDGPITRVVAVLRGQPPLQRSWSLLRPAGLFPSAVHVLAGDPIVLPYPEPAELLLMELRAGAVAIDARKHLAFGERTIRIEDLPPGDYWLASRRGGTTNITVAPRAAVHTAPDAAAARTWARAGVALLELLALPPVVERFAVEGDALVLRIAHPTASTRVHLIATRYVPDPVLGGGTGNAPAPLVSRSDTPAAQYVSGRDIGDEVRYVLERRSAPRRPGMMLEKPSLLLHPWALRTTTTARQEAAAGAAYFDAPAPAAAPRSMAPAPGAPPMQAARAKKEAAAPVEQLGFATLDFLPAGAIVRANLRPDANGMIRVPLADLGDAQTVQAIVEDHALRAPAIVEVALPARPLHARDLRLQLALDPTRHFAEQRRIDGVPADTTLVVPDVRVGKIELIGTVARAHQLLVNLLADASALTEFAFITEWPALDDAKRRERYSKYACHELNLFVWKKDPAFFAAVVRPSLADKREKTFVDRFLLGEDLSAFAEPWAFGRLNAVERALLAIGTPPLREALARLTGDDVDLIPPDPERDAQLVTTLLGVAALEVDDGIPMALAEPALERSMTRAGAVGGGGFGGPAGFAADMLEREQAKLFRGVEKTQEWAEVQWWKRRLAASYDGSFAQPNRFWRDLAAFIAAGSDPAQGPFLSPYLGDCAGSFAEAMCALAFLDLPFVAAAPTTTLEDTRLTVTPRSHALAARSSLAEIGAAAAPSAVLVGQSYVRSDDRWEWTGNEQREKRVTGPLLAGVVYRCQVVVTNPTSATEKLDVLLQIPKGSLPADRGFLTRTAPLRLAPYGTQSLDYAFYFPLPGQFTHFPAHVTRGGALLVAAPARTLDVVRELGAVDTASWSHVSQHGSLTAVLAFLDGANLGRIELDRIAWRMHDRDAFTRVTALLSTRHVYAEHLWRYALLHHDLGRAAEWLRHQHELFAELEPALVGDYQHLEYAPLINARAHRLGAERRILNSALDEQYHAFLDVLAHRSAVKADDLLAGAHYLLCMDRVDEAMNLLARVDPPAIHARAQLDYLSAYVACYRGDLAAARRLTTTGLAHPVDRWRRRFEALVQMLDEVDGKGSSSPAAPIGADSRDQHMAVAAAEQAALDLAVSGNEITLSHANLAACQLRFFKLDIELLFSRQPFVQGDVERFSFIEPGFVLDVALAGAQTVIAIPPALRGANLVIEAVAPGLRRSVAHYAHDLGVQVAHAFGQVKVVRASTGKPLPAVYVKVYSRERGGRVVFYKDGYTDLRGRLDYATLSTDDLDRVDRFALLVASDDAGATITEAPPPTR